MTVHASRVTELVEILWCPSLITHTGRAPEWPRRKGRCVVPSQSFYPCCTCITSRTKLAHEPLKLLGRSTRRASNLAVGRVPRAFDWSVPDALHVKPGARPWSGEYIRSDHLQVPKRGNGTSAGTPFAISLLRSLGKRVTAQFGPHQMRCNRGCGKTELVTSFSEPP